MEENRLTEEELAAKAAELEEREREIELKEKKLNTIDEKVVGMKESIYSHINVSVKTMDTDSVQSESALPSNADGRIPSLLIYNLSLPDQFLFLPGI